jgi:hypothetical protein
MRTSYKVLLAVLAVTIPATAATTIAGASMKKHAANSAHAAMMKRHFEAMDANQDGKVGQAEIFAYRAAKFTEADGVIDRQEVGNAGMRHGRYHGGNHRMHGDN